MKRRGLVAEVPAGIGVVVSACGRAGLDSGPIVEVTDSAGVRILSLDWGMAVAATDTVDLDDPVLRIGVREGDPRYEFDSPALRAS